MPSPDLSNRHGYFNIWPFVPVYSPEFEGIYDTNLFTGRGLAWLKELVKQDQPGELEMRHLREALGVSAESPEGVLVLDPNNPAHSHIIAPLYELGLVSYRSAVRIIESAHISIGLSRSPGTTTISNILGAHTSPNGIKKSNGLTVLDHLLETQKLPSKLADLITLRKREYAFSLSDSLSKVLSLQ